MPHCIFYNLLNLEIIPKCNESPKYKLAWFLDLKSVNDFLSKLKKKNMSL